MPTKEYYAAHKEQVKAYAALWQKEHPDSHKAANKKYREAHTEGIRERTTRWAAQNPDKVDRSHRAWRESHRSNECATAARYRAKHPDKVKAYAAAYLEAHPEETKERQAEWKRNHRDVCRMTENKRRARQRMAEVNDLTEGQWAERVAEFNGRCAYCLKPMDVVTIDHMTPLCKGGNHTLSNVVPCCKSCNSKKRDKTLLEFIAGRMIFPKLIGDCL